MHRTLIFVPIWRNLRGQFALASPLLQILGDLSPCAPRDLRPWYIRTERWIYTRMCLLRLDDWLKLLAQTTHLWGRCFSWTCSMWMRSRSRFSNDLYSQTTHVASCVPILCPFKGRLPECHLKQSLAQVPLKLSVAALHQGAPGQKTWLEDPPPWLKPWLRPAQPCVLLCFGIIV